MILTLEDWKNGWMGVDVELSVPEIDELIRLLEQIKADSEQHFHLESKYQGKGGVGMITFSQAAPDAPSNATFLGLALEPGSEIEV